MSLMSPREVLAALASGEPLSGAALARRLGVSRAAIWKQVETLRARGLPIDARAGSGYRLAWPVQLLDAGRLRADLAPLSLGGLDVHWELDSTSSEVQRGLPTAADLGMVLAESQSAARGRRGRNWLSPPASNLYLSCVKRFDAGFAALSGLSLAVGVAVARALQDLGIAGAGLKWPNDVLLGDAKLAGILVELSGEYQGPCAAVVGIGLNVRMPPALRAQAGQPVADLADATGGAPPDRHAVAVRLITRLAECLRQFEQSGFAGFAADFARFDVLRGKPLRISGMHGELQGVGAGIDARGALRVRTAGGDVSVDSADVTVRRQ
jgi:BirA family biotin operon repressor/biotin-[acetyl-CoA-carboxylase] ligase